MGRLSVTGNSVSPGPPRPRQHYMAHVFACRHAEEKKKAAKKAA